MAFTGTHSPESRAKIARARRGKEHSPQTRKKISLARRNQIIPPNLKHGGYSKKTVKANLEETCLRRISALMELTEEQIPTYVEPLLMSNQLLLNLRVFIENIENIENIRNGWLEFSLIKKKKETGDHPLRWYQCAQEDMGLNLNFSLQEVKEKQEEIVREHQDALQGDDDFKKLKYVRQIKKLEGIFCDAVRHLNGDQPVQLLATYGSVIGNKNFKTLLKLKVVLDALGLKKEIDKRQFIKGVIDDKRRKNGCKFVPIKTIASPLCILDFLFYLKTNWYERHAYSKKEDKENIREMECGLDYWETRAGTTCGYLADMVHMCRNSQLDSEISNLMEREEVVWYVMQSPALKPFRHLINKSRPDIYKRIIKIKKELKQDDRLKEILERIKLDGEERWRRSGFPVFGDVEKDKSALKWAFIEKPKIYREAVKIYEGLRSQG